MARETGPILRLDRPPQGGFYDVTILTGERGRFVLKVGNGQERIMELHDECRVLRDLHSYAPFVPQPIAHEVTGEVGLFLFTCVEGENLLQVAASEIPAARHCIMASLGQALRRIHSWAPVTNRPHDWVGPALARARRNVDDRVVANPIDHRGRFGGRDPHQVLSEVERWFQEIAIDLVYGHGDFCLPNVLVDQQEHVAGVVDWSLGGYMDRRIDLAACVWSIRYNLTEEAYVQTFLNAYGYSPGPASLEPFEALWVLS